MREPAPAEAARDASPPVLPPGVAQARIGYHRTILAISAVLLVVCLIVPAPDGSGNVRLPVLGWELPTFCMLRRECGVDCPGCGLTRCFLYAAHGRVAAAWSVHPVGLVLFAALVAQVPYRISQIWRLRQGRRDWEHWSLALPLWLAVVALLGQWILRITGVLPV